jgi:hypothetical protein
MRHTAFSCSVCFFNVSLTNEIVVSLSSRVAHEKHVLGIKGNTETEKSRRLEPQIQNVEEQTKTKTKKKNKHKKKRETRPQALTSARVKS